MRFAREFDAAYEVVAVTGALPAPDPRFERALVVGGRMFVVIGTAPVMEARLVTRTGEDCLAERTAVRDPHRAAVPARSAAVPFPVLKSAPRGLSTPFRAFWRKFAGF